MSSALMSSYQRLPVAFVRGEGVWLWDTEGRRYLDAVGGIAVCALGHAHPAVAQAVAEQAAVLVHTSNLYCIPSQERLAERLVALSGMDQAFFCNSGAEANEAAIKIARLLGHERGLEAPAIVVMEGAFHGRTLATLTASGARKVQAGFEPLVQGFVRVPYGDLEALRAVGANRREIVAVLCEPIQGEGGVVMPPPGYLAGLREVCDRHGWLLMLDEVQTGMCRTGRWFAFQHEGITPDVMTLAKSLGNGVPIGACLARGAAAGLIRPGKHASTFGGNPLACRAALAVLDLLEQGRLAERAAELGEALMERLRRALGDVPGVVEIRGRGLIIGVMLDRPCGELVERALGLGLLINVTAERVVRLLPPLILSDAQAADLVERLGNVIREFLGGDAT
ncbi:MAG: acetylornithine transaminase [Pseudomonadota bacterium]|nr:acetylornithine transaminase [Gammaproteobacteria bacterium]MDQ3583436.1 acetylornithine transaminase [Pseudomonadota bacterium]